MKAKLDLDPHLGQLAREGLGDLSVVGIPAVGGVEMDLNPSG
ncbi:hypothetical protein MASR2M79_07450 [Aminivibrio sp.]